MWKTRQNSTRMRCCSIEIVSMYLASKSALKLPGSRSYWVETECEGICTCVDMVANFRVLRCSQETQARVSVCIPLWVVLNDVLMEILEIPMLFSRFCSSPKHFSTSIEVSTRSTPKWRANGKKSPEMLRNGLAKTASRDCDGLAQDTNWAFESLKINGLFHLRFGSSLTDNTKSFDGRKTKGSCTLQPSLIIWAAFLQRSCTVRCD